MIFELSVLYRIIICLRSTCDTAMRVTKRIDSERYTSHKNERTRLITFSGALTKSR